MDAQNNSTDDLTRFAMNSHSSPTLVDLSEVPDVFARPSALEQITHPTSEADKNSVTDNYLEQLANDNRPLDDIWTPIGVEGIHELTTPKGKRPELESDTQSQQTRKTSLGSIFGESSRQLPPLPASPDPAPTSTSRNATSFNPFLDPEPATLPPIVSSASRGNGANSRSNTGPSPWLFQAAQPVSSSQGTRNPFPDSIWTDSQTTTSDGQDEKYNSQWAKHMEERSQRIQTEQREERESTRTPAWSNRPVLCTIPTSNTSRNPWQTPSRSNSSRRFPPAASASRTEEPDLEPWRRRIQDQRFSHPNQRPDIQSRNAALDTISNILFNFDCPPAEAAALLEDVCATADEVGVSTVELLAQTVTIGNFDLGMTALCLEASRCNLDGGLEVLTWLLENVSPASIEKDLRDGCLMRNNGMGDQLAWATMKLFVPEQEDRAVFAYDVTVENIFYVSDAAGKKVEPAPEPAADSDDEGSLYDDISLIDAESSLNQADIETLKSSDDEGDADAKADSGATGHALGPSSKVHRARIGVPYFESSLRSEDEYITPAYTALPPWSRSSPTKLQREGISGSPFSSPFRHMPMENRVLTAEWMHEGRVWALSMGENKLVLALRHTSEVVLRDPIKVKAFIRIFPADIEWSEVEELGSTTGSDRLLPTHSSVAGPPITPSYSCEFDEVPLIPGPPALSGNASLWKENIHMSSLSLLDLVGMSGAMKVEVVIKTTEIPPVGAQVAEPCPPVAGPSNSVCEDRKTKAPESVSGDSDAEWQQIDP